MRQFRTVPLLAAAIASAFLASVVLAAGSSASGQCQREGTTLTWVDGIAFESARSAEGRLETAIFLTTVPIDRAQLATCPDCNDGLPENSFVSPREDWLEAQLKKAKGGWFAASYVGGDMDMTIVHDVGYMAPDGVQTGITAGNERLTLEVNDGKRIAGTLHSAEGDYFGASCSGRFDLAVGWPAR
jgi:hypothetical protein